MHFQVAALCDSAADYRGKLCVLGAFDTILAGSLPAVHPQCSIALRAIFRKGEEGRHHVRVQIVDEDGGAVVPPIDVHFEVRIPEENFFLSRNAVVNLQHLKFERTGLHSIDISVDGRQSASLPLEVRLPQRPEGEAG